MNHAHDTPPGEARPDVNMEGLMFKWMRATVTMMRIKAVWALEASPAIEALEKQFDALPDGEERQRIKADLEERYSAYVRLWLHGLVPGEATTEAGPEGRRG